MELATWVALGRVDALRRTNQRYPQSGQFIHEQAQIRDRAPDAVELVGHDPLDPATAKLLHHPVELRARRFLAADRVHEELDLLPASLLAVSLQFAQLGVGALVLGANSNVSGCVGVHTINCILNTQTGKQNSLINRGFLGCRFEGDF